MPALEINQQITFLHASNLEETHRFYTDVLGLPLARKQSTCLISRSLERPTWASANILNQLSQVAR